MTAPQRGRTGSCGMWSCPLLYVGDDLTDLDAFDALRALRDDGALTTALCVGVASDETPPRLAESADMLVDGPAGVRAMLSMLAA